MIDARGIEARLGTTNVLLGVDLTTRPGQVVGLIGPNGSGKSTLLRCLYGALRPCGGAVLVDGTAIERLSRRTVARAVSVVTQDAASDGIGLSVAEFVLLGRHVHRRDHQAYGHDDRRIARAALARVSIDHLEHRRLDELSGGERQRVMIARCVAQGSPTLLLDEPTNHLDIRHQHEALRLVGSLGLDVIVVLHDLNLAARYCDHLVLLDHGRVVAAGPPMTVLTSEVLEAVYGITVRAVRDGETTHLVFDLPDPRGADRSTG